MDFEFSEIAKKDLDNILNYFIEKLFNKRAARNFYNKVCEIIENIKRFPEMYEVIQNDLLEHTDIRRVPIDNYNLYYKVENKAKKVIITRIIYAHYNSDYENKNN